MIIKLIMVKSGVASMALSIPNQGISADVGKAMNPSNNIGSRTQ